MTGQEWVVEEFTDTDKLMSVKRFKNKHPEGLWIFYYPDGKTEHLKENYENGKLSGIRYEYFENGKLAKEETYKFNLLAGPYKTYYQAGGVEAEGELRSNRRHGLFTAYHPNGKIKEQGEYIADKKHKEWKEFDEHGNLVKTDVFKAGLLVEPKN